MGFTDINIIKYRTSKRYGLNRQTKLNSCQCAKQNLQLKGMWLIWKVGAHNA